MSKKLLTVFTPTFNRAHTLSRVYESLERQSCRDFEWLVINDGSTDDTENLVNDFINKASFSIRYIKKGNGGLYTGYNTAYENIYTELCVCIDSDDFMPDNAVELISKTWREKGGSNYVGLVGLDFFLSGEPIDGYFPTDLKEVYLFELKSRRIHLGDCKQVMRTDLMKKVAPQIGFPGEKDFNPYYMIAKAGDELPAIVINENLCFVEYQETDSMSSNIYNQYMRSPRSFAKTRELEMGLKHTTFKHKVRSAIHYVAECKIARQSAFSHRNPCRLLTAMVYPAGLLLYIHIKRKAK